MIRQLLINQKNWDKTAVIENDKEISYRIIINKAAALQKLLPPKENIAILLPNSSDFIAAVWGTIGAGMTAFPLNVLMTEHEIAPLLKHTNIKAIITSTLYRHIFEETAIIKALSLKIIYMEELKITPHDNTVIPNIDTNEPMLLLNTSGTTGNHKIVQLSEKNIYVSVLGYLDKIYPETTKQIDIRYIFATPFSTAYGIMILSACLILSVPLVLLEQTYTLTTLYKAIEKHKVTHYEGSTSTLLLMEQMIGRQIPYNISTLTYFATGGTKISGNTIKNLHDAYKWICFYHGYGMTEAAPLITKHPCKKVKKVESVGNAINEIVISIATDNGIVNTPYTKGEIIVKGDNVMLGYYNNDAETNKALKNGYLYTGDIGYLDEEGYLYICGRKKNIIIVRGFKVFPEEVEECIQNSMLAKDSFVYGQIDNLGNEIVCADIIPIHSQVKTKELITYLSTYLAEYKLPKRITFCESIKKNLSGKTERKKGVS